MTPVIHAQTSSHLQGIDHSGQLDCILLFGVTLSGAVVGLLLGEGQNVFVPERSVELDVLVARVVPGGIVGHAVVRVRRRRLFAVNVCQQRLPNESLLV